MNEEFIKRLGVTVQFGNIMPVYIIVDGRKVIPFIKDGEYYFLYMEDGK